MASPDPNYKATGGSGNVNSEFNRHKLETITNPCYFTQMKKDISRLETFVAEGSPTAAVQLKRLLSKPQNSTPPNSRGKSKRSRNKS